MADVQGKYTDWKAFRRPFEGIWFLNGAMLRGQQRVVFDDALAKLVSPVVPSHKIQLTINRVRPKTLARLAKFFKTRPRPEVLPASTERKSILNARASTKAIYYQWSKQKLEEKHKDARLWASITGKSYWWFSWNEQDTGRLRTTDPTTQAVKDTPAQIGDVDVEVGSAFEVLVKDVTLSRIGQQPEIMRSRLRDISDIKQRYPQVAQQIQEQETENTDAATRYTDRLAQLNVRDNQFLSSGAPRPQHKNQIMVHEHFTAPCGKYEKGKYVVVVGDHLAKYVEELPYEMWDTADNPYPVVEFSDQVTPGQFWCTTLIEQLIDLQREYNFIRSLASENIRMVARPKIIIYKQHNLADGAWANVSGEIVELTWVPGLPPPTIVQAANIAGDCWQIMQLIVREFDDLTQVYPSVEGKVAGATSGFQTNLLQEAADSVHGPSIRDDELTLQDAARKIRRLMKLGYDIPRLLNITSRNDQPEVFEFSQNQIDEFAEVRIQVGSMLPDLKAARAQMAMDMHEKGLFGNPQDPMVRRRVLELLDMGGLEVVYENERRDEDDASQEIQSMNRGQQIKPAQFFHDHLTHIYVHQNEVKSSEWQTCTPAIQQAHIAHLITHYDWVNPTLAMGLRQQYNLTQLPVATPPPPPPPPIPQPILQGPGGPSLGPTPVLAPMLPPAAPGGPGPTLAGPGGPQALPPAPPPR